MMPWVPSVTMRVGRPKLAIGWPLSSPSPMPMTAAMTKATGAARGGDTSVALEDHHRCSPRRSPMAMNETSIPPEMITSRTARAKTRYSTVALAS